jgi:hypothetical protein
MSNRTKGEGSLSKKPNGSWLAQVTACGHRLSRVFKTTSEAEKWLKDTTIQFVGEEQEKRQRKITKRIYSLSSGCKDEIYKTSVNFKSRLRKYKLTACQYESMLELQDKRCAICNNIFTETPAIDHDHITGKIRGILCRKCNHALGLIGDSPVIALSIYEYLVANSARGINWKGILFNAPTR